MLECLLLEIDTVSTEAHYLGLTGYSKPYCVNQIHPWTLWCTFLYAAFLAPQRFNKTQEKPVMIVFGY